MKTSVKRDFNVVAKILLGLSFFATVMKIITGFITISNNNFWGINNDSLITEIVIDFFILIAIVLTFLKKPFGLIAFTILSIVSLLATLNWYGYLSIYSQLGSKFPIFMRDYGFFAIAMCFKKNGITGWKSMLGSPNDVAEQNDEGEIVIETSEDIEEKDPTTCNSVIDNIAFLIFIFFPPII